MLVTRCKITRYSLQNLLVSRCRSCLLQKITRYSLQKLLVTKSHSLLVAKFARYSLQKVTRYSLQKLLVAENHSLLVAKFACYFCRSCSLQKITWHQQKKLNKDTTEISVIYILPMYPLSLTLSTLLLPVQKPSR